MPVDRLASRVSGPSADSILPHDFPGVAGNAGRVHREFVVCLFDWQWRVWDPLAHIC